VALQAHEYIHLLQFRAKANFAFDYGWNGARFAFIESGPSNRVEAIAYLWEGWMRAYYPYGETKPWAPWHW
jgi:hypothetical protein